MHRANLHNLSNFEKYKFGIGDVIRVYKANRIIPQIAENVFMSSTYALPRFCPSCGEELTVRTSAGGVRELSCPNEDCLARHSQRIAHFCDRAAMNIAGITESIERSIHAWFEDEKTSALCMLS